MQKTNVEIKIKNVNEYVLDGVATTIGEVGMNGLNGDMAYILSIEEPTIGIVRGGARRHHPFTRYYCKQFQICNHQSYGLANILALSSILGNNALHSALSCLATTMCSQRLCNGDRWQGDVH
jgi:hypothetical protein